MKKIAMINPNVVIDVVVPDEAFRNDEISDDGYRYICKLVTKETVLLPYNPLHMIKQFINYKYAITKGTDNLNIKIEEIMHYIDYYGTERKEIIDFESNNEIEEVYDTYLEASEALIKLDIKER